MSIRFILLCDCSGSMSVEGKGNAIDFVGRIFERRTAGSLPFASHDIDVAVVTFGADLGVREPIPAAEFRWSEAGPAGPSRLAPALDRARSLLGDDANAIVIMTDGYLPGDDLEAATVPFEGIGDRAEWLIIAIGDDCNLSSIEELRQRSGGRVFRPVDAEAAYEYLSCRLGIQGSAAAPDAEIFAI